MIVIILEPRFWRISVDKRAVKYWALVVALCQEVEKKRSSNIIQVFGVPSLSKKRSMNIVDWAGS